MIFLGNKQGKTIVCSLKRMIGYIKFLIFIGRG
jgi:hypothetical protein